MNEAKWNELYKKLDENNIDGLLVSKVENRRYLTGFTGSAGMALITPDSKLLVTDFRYTEQAEKQTEEFEVVRQGDKITDTLSDLLKREDIKRLGVESAHISHHQYEEWTEKLSPVELVSLLDMIEPLRLKKESEEIEKIRKAAQIADEAFAHILGLLKDGAVELEIAAELEYFMKRKGASKASFDTIVASGHRSSLPHGVASDKVMKAGEAVTIDMGAIHDGYCSDMTRTVFLEEVDDKQREIYNIVLEAQLLALKEVRVGKSCVELDKVARDIINERGYKDNFGHGLGHGVGLEVHEGPRVSSQSKDVLEAGMIITIEPGIYIPDWGGTRIEDLVLVTEEGCEILSNTPKELTVVAN